MRHFRLESILLYLHRISVFTQNLGQTRDLVFYPDNSHVGIVGGWDANGELLIIHCASGYNNVVITGKEGFTSISRPRYYAE